MFFILIAAVCASVNWTDGRDTPQTGHDFGKASGSAVCLSPVASAATGRGYPWRGVHLDEARHFFGKEAVLHLLDRMEEVGLNVLHWHLADDQGWRLEIRRYPNLTKIGAVRQIKCKSSPNWSFRDAVDHGTYGPYFYTQDDVREIVSCAKTHGIEIVPEIEMPGHSLAALASYPEHFCFPEMVRGHETLIPPKYGSEERTIRTYCIGNDATIRFLEGVMDEVCELFPGKVIHIGGDEAPTSSWAACPKCRARMEVNGFRTPRELQGWLMNHFIDYLHAKGKVAMGWEEILLGKPDPKKVIAQCWHGPDKVLAAVTNGYQVVLSPPRCCYFNYGQGLEDDDHLYELGRRVTIDCVRAFNPRDGIPEGFYKQVLGAECCNWSEVTFTPADLEWKLWPRATALAEVLGEAKGGDGAIPRSAETEATAAALASGGFEARMKVTCKGGGSAKTP